MELSLFTRPLMILISDRDCHGTEVERPTGLREIPYARGPSPSWKCLLPLQQLRICYDTMLIRRSNTVSRHEIGAFFKIVKFCEVSLTALQRHDTRDIFTETLDTDEEARSSGRGQVGDTRTRCLSPVPASTTLSTFSILCSSLDSAS